MRKYNKNCDVKLGTYEHCKVVKLPKIMREYLSYKNAKQVDIDACLVREIKKLWRKGIRTTGCCCGHLKHDARYIGVDFEDIPKMKKLGYVVHYNNGRPSDEDSFYPKTKMKYKDLWLSINKNKRSKL